MAIRWPHGLTASVSPRGEALLLLLALFSILFLLTHELSRTSSLAEGAAYFEGFDADVDEFADEASSAGGGGGGDDEIPFLSSTPPPSTTLSHSSPESDNGLPSISPDPEPQAAAAATADFWDEDEFEGIPAEDFAVPTPKDAVAGEDPSSAAPPSPSEPSSSPPVPFSLKSYIIEIACISFLICFVINYFTGKRQNETMALAWAAKFATKDTIFDKNFSLLGTGDGKDSPLLLKEGNDVFKFYASGRRFCQGMLATMELRSRHDLLSRALDLVFSKRDVITFEVVMNDDAMDHVVLALARKKEAKTMHKEERDLQKFATLGVLAPAGRKWITNELTVVSESKEVAGDLITDATIDQVFGDKAFEKLGKWFMSLHFSDQSPGLHKKILRFKFALPDANNMVEVTRLVALVPYYIDLVGRYKLSSHARSKTEASRAKAAQEAYRELQNARQGAMQKKKAEKKKLMEEAEAKLSAEALRKKEEKEHARQLKKSMPKVKMMRSH